MTSQPQTRRRRRFDPDAATDTEQQTTPPWNEDDSEDEDRPARRPARPAKQRRTRDEQYDDETGSEEAEGIETVVVPVHRGRKAIKESRPSGDGGSAYFKWADDGQVQVLKFLEIAEPWSYNQHWVQRQGKQSFPCLEKNCPLCDIGVKVSQKIVYTVLNLSMDSGPTVQIFEVTPTLDDTLIAFEEDKKTGPLPRLWYAVSRTKKARKSGFGMYNYQIVPVKDRDLEEDYGLNLDDAEDALDAITAADIPDPQKMFGKVDLRTLREIAEEAMS